MQPRKGIKSYEFVIILPNQLACRFLDLLCRFSKILHPFPGSPPFCVGLYTTDNISGCKCISRHLPSTRQCWPKIPSWLGGRSLRKRGQTNDPRPQYVRILKINYAVWFQKFTHSHHFFAKIMWNQLIHFKRIMLAVITNSSCRNLISP